MTKKRAKQRAFRAKNSNFIFFQAHSLFCEKNIIAYFVNPSEQSVRGNNSVFLLRK